MRTEITFRHFPSDQSLKEHALKGVNKLTRFYDGITDARVVLDVEKVDTDPKLAEISLAVYRQTLLATEAAQTHEEAINKCVSELRRQILRYKGKLRSTKRDEHR